jgi:hypothetical protein
MTIIGLIAIAAGSLILSLIPATLGIPGHIAPVVVITVSYALFQTSNNTAVMTDIRRDQPGVISGMLNLSRNFWLITGAPVMGAVFAYASATIDITTARPEAVATGMRITFAVATILIVVALAFASVSHALSRRGAPFLQTVNRRMTVALNRPAITSGAAAPRSVRASSDRYERCNQLRVP